MRRPSLAAASILFLSGSLALAPAHAGVLGEIRASIGRLWGQSSNARHNARAARQRASALNSQAQPLYEKLEATQQALQNANASYFQLWGQMKETEARLVKSRHRVLIITARYNQRRALFGHRLAAMQQSGHLSYLQMFLGSHTLSDLSRRAQLFETMTESDASLQSGLRADKEQLKAANVALQHQWHDRNQLQRSAGQERKRIILAEKQRRATLSKLLASRNAMLAYSQAQEQSSRELTGMIQELSSKRAQIIAQYDAQAAAERAARPRYTSDNGPHYTEHRSRRRRVTRRVNVTRYVQQPGGELKPMSISELRTVTETVPVAPTVASHPVHSIYDGHDHSDWFRPVGGRISSGFGERYHPILHRVKLHTGEDMAASYGTPFRAARDGRVLWSGWKKAYGNTIIIDHGDGTTSLYGHASKLSVKAGQPIRAGEYIGNVGSTGYSTGPHLHFEVRKNGRPVDPSAYVR